MSGATQCAGGCSSGMRKDEPSANERAQSVQGVCYRCRERKATLFTRKASCSKCFIEVFRRNFGSNLRSRCIRREYTAHPLVLVVNGDKFSTALLHLILERSKRRYVKVSHMPADSDVSERLFETDDIAVPCVVSLDYHVGIAGTFESRGSALFRHITNVVNGTGNSALGHKVVSSRAHVMEATLLERIRLSHIAVCHFLHKDEDVCSDRCDQLKECLSHLYDTNKCDQLLYALELLRVFNLKSYLKGSSLVNPFVGVCDSQDLIASRVMLLTCVGAGHQVAFRSAFLDDHTLRGAGRIVRPLKSFSAKEIALYHRINGLPELVLLDHYWHSSPQSSILGCVNALMDSLTAAHSNTLHNISNVVEKLVPVFPGASHACRLCHQAVYTMGAKDILCVPCAYMCSKSTAFDKFASLVTGSID